MDGPPFGFDTWPCLAMLLESTGPTRHRPAALPPCSALTTQKPVSGASTRSTRASWAATPSPSPRRATGGILPHIHVSAGLKAQSADGRTSQLLSAKAQFLSELVIVEVTSPMMTRPRNPGLYDVPLLTFG
ncbi:hypothetical protein [Streptomyces venezuelae]|uniref:hypothetical protein n=1 Tax=Streptomyces venezuelae TaxID=54571 RepID=UPI003989647D